MEELTLQKIYLRCLCALEIGRATLDDGIVEDGRNLLMIIFKLLLKAGVRKTRLLGCTPSLVLISPRMETSQPLWAAICCNKLLGIDDRKNSDFQ